MDFIGATQIEYWEHKLTNDVYAVAFERRRNASGDVYDWPMIIAGPLGNSQVTAENLEDAEFDWDCGIGDESKVDWVRNQSFRKNILPCTRPTYA